MHVYGTQVQFLSNHFERLLASMQLLGMEPNTQLTPELFARSLSRALNREKLFKGVRARLTVFRNNGGLYTPETNQTSWVCTFNALPNEFYTLNPKGLLIDIFNDYKKQPDALSSLKTANSIIYVLAGIYKKTYNFDDCLLLNTQNNIIEALSSNIFVVLANKVYSPSPQQGCLNGIMRRKVIEMCIANNISVNQEIPITEEIILQADEIFLTNAIQGIQWVGGYKQRRYFNNMSKYLVNLLNTVTFNIS
jgi:branched-chain amino acid aminotransferase